MTLHIVTSLKFIMFSSKFILKWNFIIYLFIDTLDGLVKSKNGEEDFQKNQGNYLLFLLHLRPFHSRKKIGKKTLNHLVTIINVKRKQRKLLSAQGSGVCEIIIILGIFGIWFYSIGRYWIWPYGRVFQSNKHICFSGFM